MTADPENTRDNHGRWRPGRSPNPRGKPPGARSAARVALDAIGEAGAEAALHAVVRAASGGDVRAAEVLLARCWPPARGRRVTLPMPAVTSAADLPAAYTAVTAALAEGAISAEEAAAIGAVLGAHRQAIETADLAERITALEQQTQKEPHR